MVKTIGGLYLVLSEEYANGRNVIEIAREAVAGGIDMLQMREKRKLQEESLRLGFALADLCRKSGVTFIVNDDPHLAREVNADGVHLGQEDFLRYPMHAVRRILGPGKIIGLSTHSPEQAIKACSLAPDYIAYGPVFPTLTKNYFIGTSGVRSVLQAATCPVVFIGGINASNVDELLAMGAGAIALIRDIMRAENVSEQAAWYKEKFRVRGSEFGVQKNIQIRINGKEACLADFVTLAEMIASRGLMPKRVVIEYNGEVIQRERWTEIQVKEGDCLEIVSFVGGG